MSEMWKSLTDKEIDLLAQAFLLPPPFGFTEEEKNQILYWIKHPNWIELPLATTKSQFIFFTYDGHEAEDIESYSLLLRRIGYGVTGLRTNAHFVKVYNDTRRFFGDTPVEW